MNKRSLPSTSHYSEKAVALIGYGVTGKACARYLLAQGAKLSVFDKATHLQKEDPNSAEIAFYSLNENTQLHDFDYVVVSPGVNLTQDFIQDYLTKTTGSCAPRVIGDIELFAQELLAQELSTRALTPDFSAELARQKPFLIGITGSNGKSTVVDMLAQAIAAVGLRVGLGGNFGTSALDMLNQEYDVIVLELSSFQLESTYSLSLDIACMLNLTSDHIDRHGSMMAYGDAKRRIYSNAKHIIVNRDDPQTWPSQALLSARDGFTLASFGSSNLQNQQEDLIYYHNEQGIFERNTQNETCLMANVQLMQAQPQKTVGDSSESANFGTVIQKISQHQLLNIQVVLACARALQQILDFNMPPFINAISTYQGLAHRFELIQSDGVDSQVSVTWINDSKATNPGASIAAINALVAQKSAIILIAGGDAKGADLSDWAALVNSCVTHTLLIGKDAKHISTMLDNASIVADMASAVAQVKSLLNDGKRYSNQGYTNKICVLLSPACASIDMFANYQERGNEFARLVKQQVAA